MPSSRDRRNAKPKTGRPAQTSGQAHSTEPNSTGQQLSVTTYKVKPGSRTQVGALGTVLRQLELRFDGAVTVRPHGKIRVIDDDQHTPSARSVLSRYCVVI